MFLEYKKWKVFSFHRFDRDSFLVFSPSAPCVAFFSSEFLSLIAGALLLSFPQMCGDPRWSLGWGSKIWLEIPCMWGYQHLGSTSLYGSTHIVEIVKRQCPQGFSLGIVFPQSTRAPAPDRRSWGTEGGVATGRILSVLYHNIFSPQCISLPSPSPVVPLTQNFPHLISPEDKAFCQVGEV